MKTDTNKLLRNIKAREYNAKNKDKQKARNKRWNDKNRSEYTKNYKRKIKDSNGEQWAIFNEDI
jgi:hypothetical protein